MPTNSPSSQIEDLVDFFGRWPRMRQEAVNLREDPKLAPEQATMLEWMIFVIDRVGPADLDHQEGSNL